MSILIDENTKVLIQGITGSFGARHTKLSLEYGTKVVGGVTPGNAAEFLSLPNVACVGGSWLVPVEALANGDWARIEKLAREACQLKLR